jgi:hypothetical protein
MNGADESELRPITVRGLGYLVQRYAELAKVDNHSCHDLRHRFVTEWQKECCCML